MHSLFVWTTLPRPFFSNSLSTLPPCLLSVSLNCFILIRDSWIKAAGQFWIHVTLACLANKQQEGGMGVNAMSTSAWLNCPFPCLQTTYKRQDLRFIFLSTELILSKPTKKSKHSHPFNKCRFVLMCEFFLSQEHLTLFYVLMSMRQLQGKPNQGKKLLYLNWRKMVWDGSLLVEVVKVQLIALLRNFKYFSRVLITLDGG